MFSEGIKKKFRPLEKKYFKVYEKQLGVGQIGEGLVSSLLCALAGYKPYQAWSHFEKRNNSECLDNLTISYYFIDFIFWA